MHRGPTRTICWAASLALPSMLLGCTSDTATPPVQPPTAELDAPALPAPRVVPSMPDMSSDDTDGDRIADSLQDSPAPQSVPPHRRTSAHENAVRIEVLFKRPLRKADVARFERAGGRVRHVYRALAYGFTGTIGERALPALASDLGDDLLAVVGDESVSPTLDHATRRARVRAIWSESFPGSNNGYLGDDSITIAILDTGVDASHADLAGRLVYSHDYTDDAEASSRDIAGHGTLVAGIALGSGAGSPSSTGPLHFTQSGDQSLAPAGSGEIQPRSFGGGSSLLSMQATWLGGGSASLMLVAGTWGPSSSFSVVGTPVTGTSPLNWSSSVTFQDRRISAYLPPAAQGSTTHYAVAASLTSYPGVGDGAPAMRGMCPGCGFANLKVLLNDTGPDRPGSSLDLAEALDDATALAEEHAIKILNMSVGTLIDNSALRAKVESAVQNGLVVVVAQGNSGPLGTIAGVARTMSALTVGASNDDNALTQYTSFGTSGGGLTMKPDVLAPGGSEHGASLLSLDTNAAEGGAAALDDLAADDYAPFRGTSAAAPVVAGAAALIIDALQQHGLQWSWNSAEHPRRVKTLLCATATETGAAREGGDNSPMLGRAQSPKDTAEGYGIINPDAAIEAATLPFNTTFGGTTQGTTDDRRAWARTLALPAEGELSVSLQMDPGLDVDLYLYRATPDSLSEPVILAASAQGPSGSAEALSYRASTAQSAFLVVKRVLGAGSFTVEGTVRVCGNGMLEGPEQCDDGNRTDGDCCSTSCTLQADGSECRSSDACQLGQTCSAGVCSGGSPRVCAARDACHLPGSCDPSTGECNDPEQPNGHPCDDKDACTQSDTCITGTCTGAQPVQCEATQPCESRACDPATGLCEATSAPDGETCDDGNACTRADKCSQGRCTGTAVICEAAGAGACQEVPRCNPERGACESAPKPDGSQCDDGNACTQGDTCDKGRCVSGELRACPAPDACHLPGTCNPASGECTPAQRTDASGECGSLNPITPTTEPVPNPPVQQESSGCSIAPTQGEGSGTILWLAPLLLLTRRRRAHCIERRAER